MKKYCIDKEWSTLQYHISSSLGIISSNKFQNAAAGSKQFVSRLALTSNLKFHEGCVNAVNFSHSGDLIASGSDDFKICIWNWHQKNSKPLHAFDSGHRGNVFQVFIVVIQDVVSFIL